MKIFRLGETAKCAHHYWWAENNPEEVYTNLGITAIQTII